MTEEKKTKEITVQGVVVSDKMEKTVVIEVVTRHTHPKFKKIMTRTSRIKVHDEKNECQVGDTIIATEMRPLSKQKHHTLKKIVEKAKFI